jgi:hypothetical protein
VFVIYTHGAAGELFCTSDADAKGETRFKNKIIDIEAKATESNFSLFFINFPPIFKFKI